MRRKLTYEIIEDMDKRLDAIPLGELPRIYDELNSWDWSKELGEPPVDYKKYDTCPETMYLLQEIKIRCGFKSIWRYKKIEKENYTTQMFEDWWDSTFLGGEPSCEFYEWLREENRSNQCCNGENYGKNVLSFMLGFFSAILYLLFVKFCS